MSVIIAMSKLEDGSKIGDICRKRGIEVDAVYSTGAELLRDVGDRDSGIIVCGGRLRDMSCNEIVDYIPKGFDVIVVASHGVLELCPDSVVRLAIPFRPSDLVSTIQMLADIQERRQNSRDSAKLRRNEDKEIINRAKHIIMIQRNMTEPEAYRYIQKCSMDSGTKMVETAEMILLMQEKCV